MRALAVGQSPLRVAWGGVRLREACGRWRSGSRRPAPVARHRPGRQPPGRCFTRRSQGSDTFLSLLRKACHFPETRDVDEAPPGGARSAWHAGAGGRAVAGPHGMRALEVGQSPARVACGRWRSGSRRPSWRAGAGGRAVAGPRGMRALEVGQSPARVACGRWRSGSRPGPRGMRVVGGGQSRPSARRAALASAAGSWAPLTPKRPSKTNVGTAWMPNRAASRS